MMTKRNLNFKKKQFKLQIMILRLVNKLVVSVIVSSYVFQLFIFCICFLIGDIHKQKLIKTLIPCYSFYWASIQIKNKWESLPDEHQVQQH